MQLRAEVCTAKGDQVRYTSAPSTGIPDLVKRSTKALRFHRPPRPTEASWHAADAVKMV